MRFQKKNLFLTLLVVFLFVVLLVLSTNWDAKFSYTITGHVTTPIPPAPSQRWIRQQFAKVYARLNSSYTAPNEWTKIKRNSDQTYFFPKLNVIYTGIPKVGCSNLLEALLIAEGALKQKMDPKRVEQIHYEPSKPFRMSNFYERRGVYDEKIKTAISFVVLRNPWVRAVSGYIQKLSGLRSQGAALHGYRYKIINEFRHLNLTIDSAKELGLYPTFEEFMMSSVLRGGIPDKHFALQLKFISSNLVRYDYVMALEHSDEMAEELFGKIGRRLDIRGSYDKAQDSRTQASVVMAKELLGKLDQNLVDKFYKLHEMDFLLLNYSNFTDPNFPYPLYEYEFV